MRLQNTLYYNGIKILEMSYVSFEKQNTTKKNKILQMMFLYS
jgi:hypothetical protein